MNTVLTYMNYIIYTLNGIRNVFDDQIRCFKIRNPKEICKIINKESSIYSQYNSSIVFADFIKYFRKLSNAPPHFDEFVPQQLDTSTNYNINQPFSIEVKFGIKQLNINKVGGSDIIMNYFKSKIIVVVLP